MHVIFSLMIMISSFNYVAHQQIIMNCEMIFSSVLLKPYDIAELP